MAFMRNTTHFWNNLRDLTQALREHRAELLQMAQHKAPCGNARSLGEFTQVHEQANWLLLVGS